MSQESSGVGLQRVLRHKVVELSTVTDHDLEAVLNDLCPKGWNLETIHFAMRESSRRPAMAFLCFTRPEDPVDGESPQ